MSEKELMKGSNLLGRRRREEKQMRYEELEVEMGEEKCV